MTNETGSGQGKCLHIIRLECKSPEHAENCLGALANYGRPDALEFGCHSYEFGLQEGSDTVIMLVERWPDFDSLERLLEEKVIPALPTYNELLASPFDPERDTTRVTLA